MAATPGKNATRATGDRFLPKFQDFAVGHLRALDPPGVAGRSASSTPYCLPVPRLAPRRILGLRDTDPRPRGPCAVGPFPSFPSRPATACHAGHLHGRRFLGLTRATDPAGRPSAPPGRDFRVTRASFPGLFNVRLAANAQHSPHRLHPQPRPASCHV